MMRADTSKVRLFDCTRDGFTGVLSPNQFLVYVADVSDGSDGPNAPKNPYKLGHTYYSGKTLEAAFCKRYSDHSGRATPVSAEGFYVLNIDKGIPQSGANRSGFAYDEYIRGEIIKAHRAGRVDFSAVVHATSGYGSNAERLLDFDPDLHLDLVADIIKEAQGLFKRRDVRLFRTWRFGQEEVIDEVFRILQSEGLCLAALYTGFGKTVIAVEAVSRLLEPYGGLVLVLTPVGNTKNGFREAIEGPYAVGLNRDVTKTFIDGRYLDRYNIAGLRARADKGEIIFIVSNVQDARYDDGNDALRDKYRPLVGLVDVIINDERHKEFNAALTASRLAELRAPYVLNLTATPYNVYWFFTPEQVVARTLLWGLRHRDKTGLPHPNICCLDTPLSAVDPIFAEAYTAEEGFDSRKWFTRENGRFLNEKALMKYATLAYDQLDSARKNGCSLNGHCGLWKCPDGQNGDSAANYLPALAELLNSTPRDVFFIDSFTLESLAKSQNIGIGACVERLLKEKGRVTVLTCEKFLTGTDIVPLDHIVLFDKMQSIANFEQLLGRLCRVCPGKDQVWFYCVQPNTTLKVLLGQLAKAQAAVSSDVTEREGLSCLPLTYYQNDWKIYDIEDILTSVQEHFLSRLRDRVPAMSIAKYLLDSMHLLQEAPEGHYKQADVNIDALTNDTGAKVTKSNSKPSKKLFGQITKTVLAKWVECFQTFSQEMRPAAWMSGIYDLDVLLRDKMLAEIFTAKDMNNICRELTTNEGLRRTFQSTLNEVRESFAGLSVEQALDSGVFLNTKQKVNKGLVFTPLNLARKIVKRIRVKSPKRILVVNANNGAFAFAAREKWPNAEIVCVETHSYYTEWLKKNNFIVVERSAKMSNRNKSKSLLLSKPFDVMVGNPPYNINGNKNFYVEFIKLAKDVLHEGGHFALVMPNRFLSPSSIAAKAFLSWLTVESVWPSLDKHFPNIDTSIGAVVGTKSRNVSDKNVPFIFENEVIQHSLKKPTPIVNPTPLTTSIVTKVCDSAFPKLCVKNAASAKNYVFLEVAYERYRSTTDTGGEKTLVTHVNKESGIGNYLDFDTPDHAELNSWFLSRSKLGRFVVYCFANTTWATSSIVHHGFVPEIPKNTPANDQALYALFNLTDDEIAVIEKVML